MSTEYTIEELEIHRNKLKASVAYAEDVRKLMGNPLFRKVILEDFCIQSAARYVQESCDPLLTADQRADALALAQAGGHLKRWLDITLRMADSSERSILDVDDELEKLRAQPEDETE
ncbi:hypothetical protein [Klebsiella phage KP8]|uniref:Uncharacterized protein n=1 Tax=Klebsiella phage KP8 TaxID=2099850 RepID=A0A2P1CDE5_9CAUD|nr:hypothetical protein HWB55_gp084 [Klebsiella phage KP8]AVJ48985.1 hypothetical protein [Klebsiella phage KP8]